MNKLILIGICIVVMGLIALPQTLALFAGQHDFYEVSRDPDNLGVPCAKCHADVYSELSNSNVHSKIECEGCHVLALTFKGAKVGGNESIHAAASPACLDCHDGKLTKDQWHDLEKRGSGTCGRNSGLGVDCHGSPISKATTFKNATSILYGANESHIKFAMDASNATLLKGANEACIGCHTHTNVNIVWQKPTDLSFKASVSSNGVWNVTDFAAGGMKETITNGNGSIIP